MADQKKWMAVADLPLRDRDMEMAEEARERYPELFRRLMPRRKPMVVIVSTPQVKR